MSALDGDGAIDAVDAAKAAFPDGLRPRWSERQRIIGRWLEIMLDETGRAGALGVRGGRQAGHRGAAGRRLPRASKPCPTTRRSWSKLLAFKPVKPHQLLFAHWKAGYRFDPLGVLAVITPWNYPVGNPDGRDRSGGWRRQHGGLQTGVGDGAHRSAARRHGAPCRLSAGCHQHGRAARVRPPTRCSITPMSPRCSSPDRWRSAGTWRGAAPSGWFPLSSSSAARTRRWWRPTPISSEPHGGWCGARFVNTGQTCASIERVYVERRIFDRAGRPRRRADP